MTELFTERVHQGFLPRHTTVTHYATKLCKTLGDFNVLESCMNKFNCHSANLQTTEPWFGPEIFTVSVALAPPPSMHDSESHYLQFFNLWITEHR